MPTAEQHRPHPLRLIQHFEEWRAAGLDPAQVRGRLCRLGPLAPFAAAAVAEFVRTRSPRGSAGLEAAASALGIARSRAARRAQQYRLILSRISAARWGEIPISWVELSVELSLALNREPLDLYESAVSALGANPRLTLRAWRRQAMAAGAVAAVTTPGHRAAMVQLVSELPGNGCFFVLTPEQEVTGWGGDVHGCLGVTGPEFADAANAREVTAYDSEGRLLPPNAVPSAGAVRDGRSYVHPRIGLRPRPDDPIRWCWLMTVPYVDRLGSVLGTISVLRRDVAAAGDPEPTEGA